MKLRLNEKSIRLRLLKSEVGAFASKGTVATSIRFPGSGDLMFQLVSAAVDRPAVTFSGDRIRVEVPSSLAEHWCASDDVGIYAEHGGLDIIVEKDFRRTSMPSPDDDDRYPNPRADGGSGRRS